MKKVIYSLNIFYFFQSLFKVKLIGSEIKITVKGNNTGNHEILDTLNERRNSMIIKKNSTIKDFQKRLNAGSVLCVHWVAC